MKTGKILMAVGMFLVLGGVLFSEENKKQLNVVVLDFRVSTTDKELEEIQSGLSNLLLAKIAESKVVRTIDRKLVDSAIEEMKLSLKGMIDSENTKKLGKMLGADFFVTGNLIKFKETVVITAQIVNVETTELNAATVKMKTGEDIFNVVDKAGIKIIELLEQKLDEISSSDDDEDKPLVSIPKDLPRPSVLVVLPEIHIGRIVPDPAGETEVIKRLLINGFKVKDKTLSQALRANAEEVAELFGNTTLAAKVGQEHGVDLIVVGEAFSERALEEKGLVVCRARVETKAISTKNGAIIFSDARTASASDISEIIAGKTALAKAGKLMGNLLSKKLVEAWNKGVIDEEEKPISGFTIAIHKIKLETLESLSDVLKKIKGVKQVEVKKYEDKEATLDIKFNNSAWQLMRAITALEGFAFYDAQIDGKVILFAKIK